MLAVSPHIHFQMTPLGFGAIFVLPCERPRLDSLQALHTSASLPAIAIQAIHPIMGPECEDWGNPESSPRMVYMDGGIFAEADFGTRRSGCIARWGAIALEVLGPGAINMEKAEIEGEWADGALILGFNVNGRTAEIPATTQKAEGSRDCVLGGQFRLRMMVYR